LQAGEVVILGSVYVTVLYALTMSLASPTCNDDDEQEITPDSTGWWPLLIGIFFGTADSFIHLQEVECCTQ
jgi:hypothetical protein